MEEPTGMTALRQLLPPPPGAGENIDGEAAEARWGTGFPRDYRAFMAVYGVGIGSQEEIDELGVLGPFPTGAHEYPPEDLGFRLDLMAARVWRCRIRKAPRRLRQVEATVRLRAG